MPPPPIYQPIQTTSHLFFLLLLLTFPPSTISFLPATASRWHHTPSFFLKPTSSTSRFTTTPLPEVIPPSKTIDDDDTTTPSNSHILADDSSFLKPGPDKRRYRCIELSNGLEVLLVSDNETDVEAGSVHVKAGHFNDPVDRAGLAHFHEHMLFLGTKKYPDEDDYETFLSTNGGSSNAYTDMEDTNYYFSVAPLNHDDDEDDDDEAEVVSSEKISSALSGALDRLAQFFISPSFKIEAVERELRAVDSEYWNSISSDSWRNYQLLKNGSSDDHPFHKFGCGNYQTLTDGGDIKGTSAEESGGSSPRDDLLQFWEKYYHAGNVKLCVVGRADLDELQWTVEETFGGVRPAPAADEASFPVKEDAIFRKEHATYGVAAFGPAQLNKVREVIPVMDSRSIKISFATPPLEDDEMEQCRPHRVLSHLLGHESPGSLYVLLNDEGLINGLNAGAGVDTSDFSLFTIALNLTPKGMQHKQQVLNYVFQWIALVKSSEAETMRQYHDELRQIAKVHFQFREAIDPVSFASSAAEQLFSYEPSKILSGPSFTGEYDPKVIHAFLERLKPSNALITISDPGLNDDSSPQSEICVDAPWKQEKWYGARYRETTIPPHVAQTWENPPDIDSRLRLPKLNEFIPTDFSLRCDDVPLKDFAFEEYKSQPPRLLIDEENVRLWHKMDRTYRVPKTAIKVHVSSPVVYRTPRTMTYSRLYQRVLNDDLNSFVYDASIAGCNYSVGCTPTGYRISLSGYSEKLPFLLDVLTTRMSSLIEEMKQHPPSPSLQLKFQKAKDNLLRETKNYKLDSPYETTNYNSRIVMEEKTWHVDSYIRELEDGDMTLEECAEVAEESLFGRIKIEALCMGNIDQNGTSQVHNVLQTHFLQSTHPPLRDDETPTFRSFQLPTRSQAKLIFGSPPNNSTIPLIHEEVAHGETETNNAVEVMYQIGSDTNLKYEGVAVLELIGYLAYNSAYTQLRTKEQLGYIVSAFIRKTVGGARGLAVVVQSSTTLPKELEGRCEAWLERFRGELEEMSEERIAMETAAIVAQLLERDTKLADEVGRAWGEIIATEPLCDSLKQPAFDRVERLAEVYRSKTAKELKEEMLEFFDEYLAEGASQRRALSARVYSPKHKEVWEKNVGKVGYLSKYEDVVRLKQYLSTWPVIPYWK